MAKKTLEGFVVARQYDWEDQPTFSWMPCDPTEWDKDSVVVNQLAIEIDIPDTFDIRPFRVASLEKQKREIQRKFAEEVAKLDEQIKKCLAITTAAGEQA